MRNKGEEGILKLVKRWKVQNSRPDWQEVSTYSSQWMHIGYNGIRSISKYCLRFMIWWIPKRYINSTKFVSTLLLGQCKEDIKIGAGNVSYMLLVVTHRNDPKRQWKNTTLEVYSKKYPLVLLGHLQKQRRIMDIDRISLVQMWGSFLLLLSDELVEFLIVPRILVFV